MRAGLVTIVMDVCLVVFKLFAGIFGRSSAMVADAIHSLGDMLTTVVVLVGVKMGAKKADREHRYGHERFECVAAIVLSLIEFGVGVGIGWAGVERILSGEYAEAEMPGVIALVAAVVTIVVTGGTYVYKRGVARKIDSSAMRADAWHHLSDSLSSIGSFVGILGARMGFAILDPMAAILICLFILKAGFDVFRDTMGKMTDRAVDEKTEVAIREVAEGVKGVVRLDGLRTRVFGDRIYVDLEVSVDGDMTVREAHDVAQDVHDVVEGKFSKVKHCMVHVNPSE